VDRYDIERDCWTGKGEFPQLTQFRVAHGAVATKDGALYVMGGSAKASEDFGPGLDEMEVLRATKTEDGLPEVLAPWVGVSSMNVGRSYLAAAEAEGAVYVVGGCLSAGTSTTEAYDSLTDTWRTLASTLTKRDSAGLVSCDGELYAVGGFDDQRNAYQATAERYDPLEDVWESLPPMAAARRSPGVVCYRSKIYAVAGMGETADLRSVEVLDPVTPNAGWSKFPHGGPKRVCGWVSCCLIDKPVRWTLPREKDQNEKVAASKRRHSAASGSSKLLRT